MEPVSVVGTAVQVWVQYRCGRDDVPPASRVGLGGRAGRGETTWPQDVEERVRSRPEPIGPSVFLVRVAGTERDFVRT